MNEVGDGHYFKVLSRNLSEIAHTSWRDTFLVGSTRTTTIAFVADNPGKWPFHCHMLEHQAAGSGILSADRDRQERDRLSAIDIRVASRQAEAFGHPNCQLSSGPSFQDKLMFLLSKLIGFVLSPSNLIGLLALVGLLLMLVRRRRIGVIALVVAASLLVVGGWSPVGPSLLLMLEARFPKAQVDKEQVTGIILLGGAVNTHISADRGQPALNDAGERVTSVAELAARFPDARILLSGGASDLTLGEPVTESAIARDILIGLGVDPQRIETEEISRNTCENAEQSLLLAKPESHQLWLLVTSASHMPRAVACFRATGFAILPYPVDFRSRRPDAHSPTGSIAIGLQALDLAAHEWIGLISYRVLGRTKELFPSP